MAVAARAGRQVVLGALILTIDGVFALVLREIGHERPELLADTEGTRFAIMYVKSAFQLDVLMEISKAKPECETFMLYDERACFPDIKTSLALLRAHRRDARDASMATRSPDGLLPRIVEARAVRRLSEMRLPAQCTDDVFAILSTANRIFPDDPSLSFKVREYDALTEWGIDASALPIHVLVDDSHRRRAAEAVVRARAEVTDYDSTEAQMLKLELVKGSHLRRRSLLRPMRRRCQERPARLLFVSYAEAFSGAEASWAALIGKLDRERFHPTVLLPNPAWLLCRMMSGVMLGDARSSRSGS